MNWHYAIANKGDHYTVVEVYEDENKEKSWTEAIAPMGETIAELHKDLDAMAEDVRHYPVIDFNTGEDI